MLTTLLATLSMALDRRALLHKLASSAGGALVQTEPVIAREPIRFYGDVDAASCADFVAHLQFADAQDDGSEPIHVRIQSLGGELVPMMYVLDCIDALRRPVWTHVDGYAASAASLLSVYGAKRFMTKRSFVLIHELRTSIQGPYTSVLSDVHHSQELMRLMTEVYTTKTLLRADDLTRLMTKDAWLGADTCLRLRVVDAIRA